MKFIVNGGLSSKNSPIYSMESMLLALLNDNIYGIFLNVFETNDHEFIAYPNYDSICNVNSKKKSDDDIGKNIKNYTFGTLIKRHSLVKLEDLLKLFNGSSKMLVLNLEVCDNNKGMVERFSKLIKDYPNVNLYVSSSSQEVVLYLNDIDTVSRIGANICNNSNFFWNIDLDFYFINNSSVDLDKVIEKLKDNKIIMLNSTDFNYIKDIYNKYRNLIYFIIDNYGDIKTLDKLFVNN